MMTDLFSPEKRSAIMAKIKGVNTSPERTVRKIIHSLGYRFRLHVSDLPGRPDIVLPRLRKVVFVHGCFWHGHQGCRRAATPKTRAAYWRRKIDGNRARDARTVRKLRRLGWRVLQIWQCQISNEKRLIQRLIRFLEG